MKNFPFSSLFKLILRELKSYSIFVVQNLPGMSGSYLRYGIYSSLFKKCGKRVYFAAGVYIKGYNNIELGDNIIFSSQCQLYAQSPTNESQIKIGNNVGFNVNVMINADNMGEIIIGDNVMVGPNTVFRPANHAFRDPEMPMRLQGHTKGKIRVGSDVWIGSNCVILTNVNIGKGAVIGAGAVVTKDVSDFEIVGGVPAKKIGSRLTEPS